MDIRCCRNGRGATGFTASCEQKFHGLTVGDSEGNAFGSASDEPHSSNLN